jgi:hypothetical protein
MLRKGIRMTRSLFSYLIIAAMMGALLRDVQVWGAAKIFCWRKRRQTQREARQNRELRQLAAELAAHERSEEQRRKEARIAKLKTTMPYPRLFQGPLVIHANNEGDYLRIVKAAHANFLALGKSIVSANFEDN